MKQSVFLIVGLSLALAGCSGGSSSNSSTQTTTVESAAVAPSSAAATPGEAVASDLPVYPDATKVPELSMDKTRCGHKTTTVAYIVKDDVKTVSDWYAARMPGGIRTDGNMPLAGKTSIEITEIFDPSGTRVVGVTKAHFGPDIPAADQNIMNAAAVHVVLETIEPGFSASELKDAQAVIGSDAAAREAALARGKNCGK